MFKLRFGANETQNSLGYVIYDDIRQILKDGIPSTVYFENSSTFANGNRVSIYIPFNIGDPDKWGWLDCGVHVEIVNNSEIIDAFLEAKDYRSRMGDSEEMVFKIKEGITYSEFQRELAEVVKKLNNYILTRQNGK